VKTTFSPPGLENPNSEFLRHGRRLFDVTPFELIKFFIATGFPSLARKLGLRQNPKEPTDFFHSTFLQTFDYRQKNDVKRNDFVSMLLGLKDSFTADELAAEAFLVYAGGFETSSTLMTFVLYELALNPDIQQRLRDEIETEIENNNGKLTYDLLFGMKYLDQVSWNHARLNEAHVLKHRLSTKLCVTTRPSLMVSENA
jgi:cytochrome P450 family 6